MSDGLASIADKLVPSTPTVSVGAALPGDAEAMAVGMIARVIADIIETWNSPTMLAARKRQDLQELGNQVDALLLSAQSGSAAAFAALDAEASG